MQAMMSGQAAVGVAVSVVQVISSAGSVQGSPTPQQLLESKAEEKSALIFFSLSTAFMLFSAGAHLWLIRLPSYKAVVGQFTHIRQVSLSGASDLDELLHKTPSGEKRKQIVRVTKGNIIYNMGVAYIFVVTLVRSTFKLLDIASERYTGPRLSSRQLPFQSCPQTQRRIRYYSVPSTS